MEIRSADASESFQTYYARPFWLIPLSTAFELLFNAVVRSSGRVPEHPSPDLETVLVRTTWLEVIVKQKFFRCLRNIEGKHSNFMMMQHYIRMLRNKLYEYFLNRLLLYLLPLSQHVCPLGGAIKFDFNYQMQVRICRTLEWRSTTARTN